MNIEQLKALLIGIGYEKRTFPNFEWVLSKGDIHVARCPVSMETELIVECEGREIDIPCRDSEDDRVAALLALEWFGHATVADVLGIPADKRGREVSKVDCGRLR